MSPPCCPHCADYDEAIVAHRALLADLEARIALLETAAADRKAHAKSLGAAGGKARAAAMTIDERKHAARTAVTARWKKAKG